MYQDLSTQPVKNFTVDSLIKLKENTKHISGNSLARRGPNIRISALPRGTNRG